MSPLTERTSWTGRTEASEHGLKCASVQRRDRVRRPRELWRKLATKFLAYGCERRLITGQHFPKGTVFFGASLHSARQITVHLQEPL
jgi:hypothetical protein